MALPTRQAVLIQCGKEGIGVKFFYGVMAGTPVV